MSSGREIHVDLERVPADLAASLEMLPFVQGVRVLPAGIAVRVAPEGDHRKAVSELLIQRGLIPLRIEVKSPSLEEAFVTITQETVAALAPGRPADA
jgi:hypothetical protein